jgi:hypothetical protein
MQTLQGLAQYVRSSIPVPQAILQMRINERAAGITFIWQGVEFFVNSALYAFELRGRTLYITGLSVLLQTVLMGRKSKEKNWQLLMEQLAEAETILRDERYIRHAVDIVRTVRENAERLLGRPVHPNSKAPIEYPSKSTPALPAAA